MNKPESEIDKRVKEIANYFIAHSSTVRATAKVFYVSKSTVHKDLTDRLPLISPTLSKKVSTILEKNKAERAIRGGNATKEKYLLRKKEQSE